MKSNISTISFSKSRICILFLLFGISLSPSAQHSTDTLHNTLTVKAQLRTRGEYRHGAFRPLNKNEDPAALISERIRLSFEYKYKDQMQVKIVPQSVGIWGQEAMVQGAESSGNRLAFFEAWAMLKIAKGFDLKVGRQVISLDDERFLGEVDWAQGARAHDAVALLYKKSRFELNTYLAFNQNYRNLYNNNLSNPAGNVFSTAGGFPYKHMQSIWASIPVSESAKVTLLVNNIGLQDAQSATDDSAINNVSTIGANYFVSKEKFSGGISAYYQFAEIKNAPKISAYLIAANASFKAGNGWTLGAGSDLISGNDVGGSITVNHSFTPYFATGHKFFGSMDYFYAGNGHKGVGVSDTYLNVGKKFAKGTDIRVAFHQFITPNVVSEGSGKDYAGNLGQELDLTGSMKINTFASVTGGYSVYFNTKTIDYLKSVTNTGQVQHWVWLSLNIHPLLFNTKF